jgi:hypothetical protein
LNPIFPILQKSSYYLIFTIDYRGLREEGRRQKTEYRRQNTEGRRQEAGGTEEKANVEC